MGGSEDILSTSTSSHSESSNLIFFGVLVNGVTGLFLTLKGLQNSFCAFVGFFDGVLCFLEENGLRVPTDLDFVTKLFLIVNGLFNLLGVLKLGNFFFRFNSFDLYRESRDFFLILFQSALQEKKKVNNNEKINISI